MKTYEDGLNEAWEMAKRIVCLRTDGGESAEWLQNVFRGSIPAIIIAKYSASEAIKQVKEYEEIKVGDEVKKGEIKGVVIDAGSPKIMSTVWWQDGIVSGWARNSLNKTGRHFPEIAEVLKQMQEGEK